MTFLLAIVAGALGAVVGWAVTALATVVVAGYFGVSDFEGARGMLAFFGTGPIGGVITMILAIWLVLRRRGGKQGAGLLLGKGVLALAGIAALAAGAFYFMYEMNAPVNPGGPPPRLVFEIRLPPGAVLPASPRDFDIEMHTERDRIPANLASDWRRMDGDRPVLAGGIEIFQRTSQRLVVLRVKDQPTRMFSVNIGRNPARTAEFGPWERVSFIDDMKPESQPRKPGAEETYEIRYRVDRND